MKVISKNYHGKVYHTGVQGYSPKVALRQIKKILEDAGCIIVEEKIAKTGTIYLDVRNEENKYLNCFDIRISNHTKRGCQLDEVDSIKEFTCIPMGQTERQTTLNEINILNNEMKEEVFSFIRKYSINN